MDDNAANLQEATHPRSILNLNEAPVWHLLIDETGTKFNRNALDLPACDHEVGRVVGLLHPENHQLPALPAGFHATEQTPFDVHHILSTLLNERQIGILGVTVQLDELDGHSWINAVRMLTRWVLALLPASGAPVKVKVYIEQRAMYAAGADLRALADTVTAEMRALSPQRLGKLKLGFNVIEKTGHPHNGYVDSLAYVWGSPKASNKRFIQHTELQGKCLIESDSNLIERLFLNIQHTHKLTAQDWYEIASIEPSKLAHTLLAESLAIIERECQQDASRWAQYLDYCCQLQQQKVYQPQALFNATQWLGQAAPEHIGVLQRLKLKNTQLAAANHMGQVQRGLAAKAATLAESLFDEDAQLACRTALRTIVMHCNAFEFSVAEEEGQRWLQVVDELPSAVVGKKNLGKLQSSMGQVLSFSHNPQAGEYFAAAIETFNGLQDAQEAQAEIAQTRHYQLIQLMDANDVNETSVCAQLCEVFAVAGEIGLRKVAIEFAQGNNQDRFAHYLLLRACSKCPTTLKHVARAYWSMQQHWQIGAGHPWPLISLHRALLLWGQQANFAPNAVDEDVRAQALMHLDRAIQGCRDSGHGGVMFVMADVFEQLRHDMQLHSPSSLGVSTLVQALHTKLPFTFH
ncbi:hypothetical protein [Aliidiomarina maris]|uniref:Uncharacterized protein n=1 Tax=Aliidiomarina maris TaxID=531312 RepID=A0A327WN94_9GAMM|nr:hypothetical protein [Aliidiomarina maris]RAJ92964.1 hypothetical protein B0I24_1218 [Aliidiomarina maris]RUO18454.1 hypothetical protein CWE07_13960 [Aliidiomarina maris]